MKYSIDELLNLKEAKKTLKRIGEYRQLLKSDRKCAEIAEKLLFEKLGCLEKISIGSDNDLVYLSDIVRSTAAVKNNKTRQLRKQAVAFIGDILRDKLTTINKANLQFFRLSEKEFDSSFFDSILYSSLVREIPEVGERFHGYDEYEKLVMDAYRRNLRLFINLYRNRYLTQKKDLAVENYLAILDTWNHERDDLEEYRKIENGKIKTDKDTREMDNDEFLEYFEQEWPELKKFENNRYQFDVEGGGDLSLLEMERYLLLPFMDKVKINKKIHNEVTNFIAFQYIIKPYFSLPNASKDILKGNFSFLIDKYVKELMKRVKKEEKFTDRGIEQEAYNMNEQELRYYFDYFFKQYDPFAKEKPDNLGNSGRKDLKIKRGKISDFSDLAINKSKKIGIPLTLYLERKLKNTVREIMPSNTERYENYNDEIGGGSISESHYDYEDEDGVGYFYRDRAARLIGVAPKTLSGWTKDEGMGTKWHGKYRIFSDEYIERAKIIKEAKEKRQKHEEEGRKNLKKLAKEINKPYTSLLYQVGLLIKNGMLPDLANRRKNKQSLAAMPEEEAVIRASVLPKKKRK